MDLDKVDVGQGRFAYRNLPSDCFGRHCATFLPGYEQVKPKNRFLIAVKDLSKVQICKEASLCSCEIV